MNKKKFEYKDIKDRTRTPDYLGDLRKKYLDSGLIDEYYGPHPNSAKIWDRIRTLSCLLNGSTSMKYVDRDSVHDTASGLLEYVIALGKKNKVTKMQTAKLLENAENFIGMPTDFFLSNIIGHDKLNENNDLDRKSLTNYKELGQIYGEDIDTFEFTFNNLKILLSETGYGEPEICGLTIVNR